MSVRILIAYVALFALSAAPAMASVNPRPGTDPYAPYYGNYVVAPGHMIGIDRFITPSGKDVVLFSDYQSGIVRRLFPGSGREFVMGPGFDVASPVKLRVRFIRDGDGKVSGASIVSGNQSTSYAKRIPIRNENVSFFDGKIRLSGTLMVPKTPGPHPAIILLHGSGPLTRYSFGPYPHFFTSLGLAVLIYDKRGTGAASGMPINLGVVGYGGSESPDQLAALKQLASYPRNLENDALAAFRFLRGRKEINPDEIGFWGSSEGGMLATQVAARNHHVAFAINSSGFEGPLWKTMIYQNDLQIRKLITNTDKADKAIAYLRLWVRVARSGKNYKLLLKRREELSKLGKPLRGFIGQGLPTLKEMRWSWGHVLSFDSLPALKRVTCPVLGLWGALDAETDAVAAERNARAMLIKSGNKDFTLRIFPNANHALQEMPARARMAPGVFETLRSWLLAHVH